MRASRCVGRVGGLAVALGIGVAVTVTGPAAWATPADSASSTAGAASTSGPASRSAARVAKGRAAAQPSAASVATASVAPTAVRRGIAPAPAAGGVQDSDASPAAQTTAVMLARPAAVTGGLDSTLSSSSGGGPLAPAQSAAQWVVAAAARRETGSRSTVRSAGSAQAPAAAVDSGDPVHPVAPAAAVTATDPITAFVAQVQAAIAGIVDAVAQVITGVVTALNQIVTAVVGIFIPPGPVNAAPTIGIPAEGSADAVTGAVTATVSATDSDGDVLTYTTPSKTSKGSVVINAATGEFTYTPTVAARENAAKAGASAADKVDTVTVTVTDGKGGSATSAVTVPVMALRSGPINSAPVSQGVTVGAPDAVSGVVVGRVNVSDADGDAVVFSSASVTAKGLVNVEFSTGVFTFTPTAAARQNAAKVAATEADQADTFTVVVRDGRGGSISVPVTVTIGPAADPANGAPAAGILTVGAPNAVTGVVLGSVIAIDPDADPLTYSGSVTTSKGSVTVAANGAFTYTPTATARHNAAAVGATTAVTTDGFTVTASDGIGGIATIPVTVTVGPANVAPVAGASTVGTPDATSGVVIGTVSVTDADGDTLTYSAPASTAKGSIALNASTGNFSYTPTPTARQNAALPEATTADRADEFAVNISDGYGGTTSVQIAVSIGATAPARAGDIRVQPDGNRRAMYAPNVAVFANWIGVDPLSGGVWLTDEQVSGWLDVAGPTGAELSGPGPYETGDIKVPPNSVAGSVTAYAVKTGPPLTNIYSWMVCTTSNACFGLSDVNSNVAGFPFSQWVDLRI